jgi:lipid A disaccharide synthetase
MLSIQLKRNYSASNGRGLNKSVAIMANSRQGDIVGQRIMQSLKQVSGVTDFDFFGYGGPGMRQEGMSA